MLASTTGFSFFKGLLIFDKLFRANMVLTVN